MTENALVDGPWALSGHHYFRVRLTLARAFCEPLPARRRFADTALRNGILRFVDFFKTTRRRDTCFREVAPADLATRFFGNLRLPIVCRFAVARFLCFLDLPDLRSALRRATGTAVGWIPRN